MPYVEQGYSQNYVEGDTIVSPPLEELPACDNTLLIQSINELKSQNNVLQSQYEELLTSLNSFLLTISQYTANTNSKLSAVDTSLNIVKNTLVSNNLISVGIKSDIQEVISLCNSPVNIDTSTLVTKEYLDSKIPFVDSTNIKAFPAGTKVKVTGYDSVCEVVGSFYLPYEDFTYLVVYTVSHVVDGVVKISNFPNMQVYEYVAPIAPVVPNLYNPDSSSGGGLASNPL